MKASWHLAGGRTHIDIGGRFTGLGLKTVRRPGAHAVRPDGGGGGHMASRQSLRPGEVGAVCPSGALEKSWIVFPQGGIWIMCFI